MLQDAMTASLPAEELKPSRLLFSSYGFRIPIIREKFAKVIPQNDLQNKICVVIPYAGFNEEQTFLREKQALEEFGFSSENVLFLKSRADLILQTPDYIYVPGGNPFKLLNTLREKELLKPIAHCVKKQNAVYIGVSAGADLATENIKYVTLLEDNNEKKDLIILCYK